MLYWILLCHTSVKSFSLETQQFSSGMRNFQIFENFVQANAVSGYFFIYLNFNGQCQKVTLMLMLLSVCLSCSQGLFRAHQRALQLKLPEASVVEPVRVPHSTTLKSAAALKNLPTESAKNHMDFSRKTEICHSHPGFLLLWPIVVYFKYLRNMCLFFRCSYIFRYCPGYAKDNGWCMPFTLNASSCYLFIFPPCVFLIFSSAGGAISIKIHLFFSLEQESYIWPVVL